MLHAINAYLTENYPQGMHCRIRIQDILINLTYLLIPNSSRYYNFVWRIW